MGNEQPMLGKPFASDKQSMHGREQDQSPLAGLVSEMEQKSRSSCKSEALGMICLRVILTFVILLSSCLGQDRVGTDPRVALPILKQVLAKANVSGSLAYWGRCDFHKPYPDFPALSYPSTSSGSPVEVLQKTFASDPKMEVRQEPNGIVRMFETDVPTDLLDVTISHVSFVLGDQQPDTFGGPDNAMSLVLSAPEVIAYRKAHNIGPLADLWYRSGGSASRQKVTGDLYNVTVKQALDYILQFYPGFWIYENCQSDDANAGRSVFLSFFIRDIPHN
jgi:hypothetical protein